MIYQVEVNEIGTFWQLNGKVHREDGPAVEYANGSKEWYRNGKYHREDGPAIEWADGSKYWWLNGKQYTEEEFNRAIKNDVPEYTMEEAIKLIGHEFKIKK